MGVSGGNWADLPIEVLGEMLTKLPDIEDLIRFGCVCGSWRSASVESDTMKKSFVPWIMLSEPEPPENFLNMKTLMLINMFDQKEEEEEEDEPSKNEEKDIDAVPPSRKFFNVSTKKTVELYLPEGEGRRCWGSKFGWLLTIGLDLNIHLLNPLTRLQISLPPKATFPYQFHLNYEYEQPYDPFDGEGEIGFLRRIYLEKFALSADPNIHGASCVVMVIYSEKRLLAFATPGDKAWTEVKCHREWFDDVIFFKNVFIAVQRLGYLVVCDITTPMPIATDFMPPPFPPTHCRRFYLVEMSRGLYLVVRIFKEGFDSLYDYLEITVKFKVYKLDLHRRKWYQVRSLGKYALFLGNNASFAIIHPDLRSNCIYFTDDFTCNSDMKTNCDMGLFDFGEKKIVDPLCSYNCARSTFSPPLFFIPNLH